MATLGYNKPPRPILLELDTQKSKLRTLMKSFFNEGELDFYLANVKAGEIKQKIQQAIKFYDYYTNKNDEEDRIILNTIICACNCYLSDLKEKGTVVGGSASMSLFGEEQFDLVQFLYFNNFVSTIGSRTIFDTTPKSPSTECVYRVRSGTV
jgi:hypothetical protein